MSQDNKKSFVMYQGDGSNNVFSVPMTKGKYGTISVAFVRRGLDQYEYNPDTWGLNGGLFAWDLSGTKVYTDTATPAIGATIYDQYGVDTGDTVTAVGGATITVNTDVYTRDTLHDVDENTVLTWTGDTLQIGDYIVIERTTTRTQPFEFQNNQKHIEKSDDNLERQIQEVADKVDNALLVDPTHTIDSNKMNPVEWMQTILRSVDKSVRGFRYLNGWLDYSLDDPNIADVDKTWTHLVNTDNIKAIREQSRIENNETIYYTEYLAQDGSWKTLSDPHKWDNMKLSDLADTVFSNLSAGNFIMFDGLKWKNVYSSATASWGTILGDITDQTDLKIALDGKVEKAGDTMTGALNIANIASSNAALLTLTHSNTATYKWNIAPRYNSTTLSVYPGSTETNGFRFATTGFVPSSDNARYLGSASLKWKGVYTGTLNNGADLVVPNKAGTLATMGDVELAARSGRMLTDQGVWYAKMYSATVPPAAENGTNYADFSQVDGDSNPIIVIYERQSGAWVQTETITPPADYDGYVPITSKIWDIAEQTGQQGGRILWNHVSKEFTPYPTIISFEDIEVTGDSTVIMPLNPSGNQIVNKDYVDNHIPTGLSTYHPSLFAHEWDDKLRNDVQWLLADTFSWQPGSTYEPAFNELFNDIHISTSWYAAGYANIYTKSLTPAAGDTVYSDSACTTSVGTVASYDELNNSIVYSGTTYTYNSNTYVTPESETVAGYTVSVYTGHSGRKIVSTSDETNVANIYTATGVAWYYIIDIPNKRFKLPRKHSREIIESVKNPDGSWYRLYADGWVEQGGVGATTLNVTLPVTMSDANYTITTACNYYSSSAGTAVGVYYNKTATGFTLQGRWNGNAQSGIGVSWEVKGMASADVSKLQNGKKHLYFYVGEFTQTALENTAGLNAGLFNGKADTDLANALANIDFVIERQEPNAGNNYTWYRKYRSGWVEQGGYFSSGSSGNKTINLPVEMADLNYRPIVSRNSGSSTTTNINVWARVPTLTTSFIIYFSDDTVASWQVSGMAA